jgi:H+/Cl- antiporter ClcA
MLATTLGFSSGRRAVCLRRRLFIGAMLGTAIGTLQQIWLPHLTGPIGSYTLAGMGVLFAAFLRAPLTSVFMVLEVSGNYSIVAPVILANTVAYLIAEAGSCSDFRGVYQTGGAGFALHGRDARRGAIALRCWFGTGLERRWQKGC